MKKIRSLQIRVTDPERDEIRQLVQDSGVPLSVIVRRVAKAMANGADFVRREQLLKVGE